MVMSKKSSSTLRLFRRSTLRKIEERKANGKGHVILCNGDNVGMKLLWEGDQKGKEGDLGTANPRIKTTEEIIRSKRTDNWTQTCGKKRNRSQ